MKNTLLFIALLLAVTVFSQKKRAFAILPECENAGEPKLCMTQKFQDDIMAFFSDSIKNTVITRTEKTFFTVPIMFITDENGKTDPESILIKSASDVLNEKIKMYILGLPSFLPESDKRNKSVKTVHTIRPTYKIDREKNDIIIPDPPEIDKKDIDSPFFVIEEVPVYPGCKRVKKEEKKDCFNQKLQEHIRKHFRYPKEAQEMGIEGKVNILFTIDRNGAVANIKIRGPHKVLEDEALRIIKKVPRITPGKYRGVPIEIPFAIPITFRL